MIYLNSRQNKGIDQQILILFALILFTYNNKIDTTLKSMNQTQIAALVEQATSADNQRPPIDVINQIVEQVNNKDQK